MLLIFVALIIIVVLLCNTTTRRQTLKFLGIWISVLFLALIAILAYLLIRWLFGKFIAEVGAVTVIVIGLLIVLF